MSNLGVDSGGGLGYLGYRRFETMQNNPKESKREASAMTAILEMDKVKRDADHLLSGFDQMILDRAIAVLTEIIRVERGEF
jgi:hypothetical protein